MTSEKKQISSSVDEVIVDIVNILAEKEQRSFSQMVEVLLKESPKVMYLIRKKIKQAKNVNS